MGRNTKRTRIDRRIQDLEKSLKEKLEDTGLINHVSFHYGDLNDSNPDKRPYIEFKKNQDSRHIIGKCEILESLMRKSLAKMHCGTILGTEQSEPYPGIYRIRLITNPESEIFDNNDSIKLIMLTMDNALDAYIDRYKSKIF